MKQLNSAEWRRLLRQFVSKEDIRPVFMSPFEQGGWVCASDTHIILRVDKKYIADDYSTDKKVPNVASVTPQYNPQYTITKISLEKTFIKCGLDYNLTKIDCPHCDIENEVEWEYTDRHGGKHTMWAECPCCKGSGSVLNGIDRYCELPGGVIVAHYMILLYQVMSTLNVDKVTVTQGDKRQYRFNIADGIDIVVMPAYLENPRSESVTRIKITSL